MLEVASSFNAPGGVLAAVPHVDVGAALPAPGLPWPSPPSVPAGLAQAGQAGTEVGSFKALPPIVPASLPASSSPPATPGR